MTGRAVDEWIGATPDTPIPKRVKLRIWTREDGRCYLSKRKIQVGDSYEFEHRTALCNGGENREGNIFLALSEPHKAKTRADRDEKAKTERMKAKHRGLWPKPKRQLQGRGFEQNRFAPSSAKPAADFSPGTNNK